MTKDNQTHIHCEFWNQSTGQCTYCPDEDTDEYDDEYDIEGHLKMLGLGKGDAQTILYALRHYETALLKLRNKVSNPEDERDAPTYNFCVQTLDNVGGLTDAIKDLFPDLSDPEN